LSNKGHASKGIERGTSKQPLIPTIPASVTSVTGKSRRSVTPANSETPRTRYEALEPWLKFANLPNGPELQSAFIAQFASRPIGTFPPVFFQFKIAVELSETRGAFSEKLARTYELVRNLFEQIRAGEPSAIGSAYEGGADELVSFPITFFVDRTEAGRVTFQPDPLLENFKSAIDGVESDRVRLCPICSRFFFALRITQRACSTRCNQTRRVRAWREKQTQYEYTRKLKSAGLKARKEKSQ
jgi:hypothetical protein